MSYDKGCIGAMETIKSTIQFVFLPVFLVASMGTGFNMRPLMRLKNEQKFGVLSVDFNISKALRYFLGLLGCLILFAGCVQISNQAEKGNRTKSPYFLPDQSPGQKQYTDPAILKSTALKLGKKYQ